MYRKRIKSAIVRIVATSLLVCLQMNEPAGAGDFRSPSQTAPGITVPPASTEKNTPGASGNADVISQKAVDESSLAKAPTLETLERYAAEHNPAVRQAYFAWQAAQHRIVSSSSYENPMLTFSPDTQNMRVTANGMEANAFGFSQTIPFPGKLTLKGQVAERQARAMREQIEAVLQEVSRQVRRRYADYYLADRSLEVNDATAGLMRQYESIAREMYGVGRAPQQDPLQAQEEISRLAAERVNLESQRNSAIGALNAALDRPSRAPIGTPQELAAQPLATPLEELAEIANDMRPELRAQQRTIEASERAVTLAKMGYLADVTVSGDYVGIQNRPTATGRMGNGHDIWMATVGLSIPIWVNRVKAEVNEAEANVMEEKFRRRDLGNTVGDEIQDAYERLNAAARNEAIYRSTLMPETEQRIEATRADYETGKLSFLALIDSLKSFEAVRLMRYQAIAQYQQAAADLQRAVGREIAGISR